MPSQTLTLRLNATNSSAIRGIEGTTKAVTAMVRDCLRQFETLNAARIDQGVLEGAAGIERAFSGLIGTIQEATAELVAFREAGKAAGLGWTSASKSAKTASESIVQTVKQATESQISDAKLLERERKQAARDAEAIEAFSYRQAVAEAKEAAAQQVSDAKLIADERKAAAKDAADLEAFLYRQTAAEAKAAEEAKTRAVQESTAAMAAARKAQADAEMEADALMAEARRAGARDARATIAANYRTNEQEIASRARRGTVLGNFGRGVASAGTAGAVGITGLAALGFAADVNFQAESQKVLGNTSITPLQQAQMNARVLELLRTGTPEDQLFEAYMHAGNFGYKGKEGDLLVNFANRAGIATRTPVSEMGDTVAGMMAATTKRDRQGRLIGAPMPVTEENLNRMFGVMHAGAINSNMTLRALETSSTRSIGTGFALGVAPDDILALYSALVKHRLNPSRTDTQISGLLYQIAAPSPKAIKEAQQLGIGDVFNAAGLANPSVGAMGVIGRVRDAVNALPLNERPHAMRNLFNNRQGGFGAMLLTGAAWQTANDIRYGPQGTQAAWQGKVDFVNPLYAAAQKTPGQAVAQVKGVGVSDAVKIGDALQKDFVKLGPVLIKVMDTITKLVLEFAKLPAPIQETVLAFGGLVIVGKALESLTGLGVLLPGLGEKLGLIRAAGLAAGEGEAAAAAGAAGLALPITAAVAAIALLAVAWKTDFGHIREITRTVLVEVGSFFRGQFGSVLAWYHRELPQIQETTRTVLAAIQGFWKEHGTRIMAIIGPAWDLIKQTVTNALHLVENIIDLAMDLINGHWKQAWGAFKGILLDIMSELASVIVNGGKIVGNAAMLLVDRVISIIKQADIAIYNIGKNIVLGLIRGIEDNASKLGSAVYNLAKSAIDKAEDVLGIQSPSKVFRSIGRNLGEGLAGGITDSIPGVITASQAMAQAAADVARERLAIRTKYRNEEAALSARERASGSGRNPAAHAALANARDRDLTAVTIGAAVARAVKEALGERIRQAQGAAKRFAPIAGRVTAEFEAEQDAGPNHFARQLARLQDDYDEATSSARGIEGGGGRFGSILQAYGQIIQSRAASIYASGRRGVLDAQSKEANELADKTMLADVEFGYKSAADAAAYFQKRVDDLTAAGKHGSDEWIEAMRSLRQFNQQVDETQLGRFKTTFDDLKADFADPSAGHSLTWYASGLQRLIGSIDDFVAQNPQAKAALESFRAEVSDAAAAVDQRNVAAKFADIKNSLTAPGGDRGEALTSLQGLLPLTTAGSALQEQIKAEIARLGKESKAEADGFWKDFTKPLGEAAKSALNDVFEKKSKRKSGKEILSALGMDEMDAALKIIEDKVSETLQGALLGTKGTGNPFGFLGGVLGRGRRTGAAAENVSSDTIGAGSLISGLFSDHGGKGDQAIKNVKPAFKDAKASLLEGATAVYGAASALAAAFGKKHKKGGLFGAILGGVIGAYTGDWMSGVGIGSQLGGMLGFADGGSPPVNMPSIVGERGPEVFIPRIAGTVISNRALKAALEGGVAGGSMTINHTTNHYGDVNGVADYEERQRENARSLERTYRSLVPAS